MDQDGTATPCENRPEQTTGNSQGTNPCEGGSTICPYCGRCPHCGRGYWDSPYFPGVYPWVYPRGGRWIINYS